MKRSNRLVLLIGIFLAIVAFVLIVVMLGGNGGDNQLRPTAAPTTGNVVVATKDIELGAAIQQDQVGLKEIDAHRQAGRLVHATRCSSSDRSRARP